MSNLTSKSTITLALISVMFVTGCSTLSRVGDLNPFAKDSKEGQGDVAGESDRISILTFEDQLKVSEDAAPGQVVLPEPYRNADWPQTGGNTAHVMQHTGATGPLDRVWSKDIGKSSGRKGRVLAPPVIGDGRIFVVDAGNKVTAFDETTGSKIWTYKIEVQSKGKTRVGKRRFFDRVKDPLGFSNKGGRDKESVGGGLALNGGKLYVSSGLGVMMAIDAASGTLVWETPIRAPLHSAPAVDNGRAFAVSDDNEMFAFNANTGEVIWTYQGIVESARMLTVPSPAIVDDTVIAPFASGELVALRAQNGGVLWQDALSSSGSLTPLSSLNDIAAGPAIADGYVIATAQSGVLSAFDLRTGQRIWTQPAGSIGFPLVAGDFVYTVTTDGQVVCASKLDGSVMWITQLQSYKNKKKRKKRISWSGPVLASERLVLFSSRGKMVVLNPYTGEILREGKTGGDVFISPVIANETIYVVTDSAKLVAIR